MPTSMIVFLNGEFVPEERAVVSVFDRGFRYGDALFEAVLVVNGKFFRWPQHFARLQRSAQFLKIPLPCTGESLLASAQELLRQNSMRDAVLRIQLSRGTGPRGYAPTGQEQPFAVMSLHPPPPPGRPTWKLVVGPFRVPAGDALAGHKTCSRLLQVMAADDARGRGADESLLLNTQGEVTEGGSSNVFWIERGTVCTPPLATGALPGVTRAAVLEICDALRWPRAERMVRPEELFACAGVFLTLSSRGVVEAESLEGRALNRSPLSARLRDEFEALLARECA